MNQLELSVLPTKSHQVLTVENFTDGTIDAFIASRHISEVSARAYRNALKQMLKYFTANKITAPTSADVDDYINRLRADTKTSATLRLYSTIIKLFFTYLERQGIYRNCAAGLTMKLRKSNTHLKKALTIEQARSLITSTETTDIISLRNRAIIALALTTGLRTIEIERADVGDLREGSDCYYLDVQGKGHLSKDDTVKVSHEVAALIFEYLHARKFFSANSPLFVSTSPNCSKYGDRLSAQSVGKLIKAQMKVAGINDAKITAHSCRHFAATTAIKAGCDLREVSAMLRHSNVNITMTYLHDINLENRQAELAVATSLFGSVTR